MTPTKKPPAPAKAAADGRPRAAAKKAAARKAAARKATAPKISKARKATTGGHPMQVGAPPPEFQL